LIFISNNANIWRVHQFFIFIGKVLQVIILILIVIWKKQRSLRLQQILFFSLLMTCLVVPNSENPQISLGKRYGNGGLNDPPVASFFLSCVISLLARVSRFRVTTVSGQNLVAIRHYLLGGVKDLHQG
jgi:hypothetical protein